MLGRSTMTALCLECCLDVVEGEGNSLEVGQFWCGGAVLSRPT
jgi:hypothetical protein